MSICKIMYFVVLFLFLHLFGMKANLAWLKIKITLNFVSTAALSTQLE